MPRVLFLALGLTVSALSAFGGQTTASSIPPSAEQKALALLKPPLPDISRKKLLPDALFAACQSPGSNYRCVDYLAVACALQTLPKEQAEAQLRQWVQSDKQSLGLRSRVLCLIMFEPKPGEPFDPPWIKPDFVQIVDGVPFVRGFGGLGGRPPDPPVTYFDYCYMHGQWTTRHYHPVTPADLQAALAKLLVNLTDTSQIIDFERQHLQMEIQAAPLVPNQPVTSQKD